MELEIVPEPSPAECAAIRAALELERVEAERAALTQVEQDEPGE
jgi:hypothetical protein